MQQDDDFNPSITYEWYSDTFNLSDESVRLTPLGMSQIAISGQAIGDDVTRVHIGLRYSVGAFEYCGVYNASFGILSVRFNSCTARTYCWP